MGTQYKEIFTNGRAGSLQQVSALASKHRLYLFFDMHIVLYCAGIMV